MSTLSKYVLVVLMLTSQVHFGMECPQNESSFPVLPAEIIFVISSFLYPKDQARIAIAAMFSQSYSSRDKDRFKAELKKTYIQQLTIDELFDALYTKPLHKSFILLWLQNPTYTLGGAFIPINLAQPNKFGYTLFEVACALKLQIKFQKQVFPLLLPYAAPDTVDRALYFACINQNYAIAEKLLKEGANINYCPEMGGSALHHAVISGDINLARFLLWRNADVDLLDANNKKPIDYLIKYHRNNAIGRLLGEKLRYYHDKKYQALMAKRKNTGDEYAQPHKKARF